LLGGERVCDETTIVAAELGDPGAVAFERALAEERRLNVRRLGLLRFVAVSAFFALFLLLGGALRIAYWQAPIPVFAGYWVVVGLSAWIARRVERPTTYAALTVPLVDMPALFLVFSSFFTRETTPVGPAAFAAAFYVFLVIPVALISFDDRIILFTAVVGGAFETLLLRQTGAPGGTIVSSVLLMGTTAAFCSYASRRRPSAARIATRPSPSRCRSCRAPSSITPPSIRRWAHAVSRARRVTCAATSASVRHGATGRWPARRRARACRTRG